MADFVPSPEQAPLTQALLLAARHYADNGKPFEASRAAGFSKNYLSQLMNPANPHGEKIRAYIASLLHTKEAAAAINKDSISAELFGAAQEARQAKRYEQARLLLHDLSVISGLRTDHAPMLPASRRRRPSDNVKERAPEDASAPPGDNARESAAMPRAAAIVALSVAQLKVEQDKAAAEIRKRDAINSLGALEGGINRLGSESLPNEELKAATAP